MEGHERWWDAIWRAAAERGDLEVFFFFSSSSNIDAWAGRPKVFFAFFLLKNFWRAAAERGDLEVFFLLQILTLERDGLIFFFLKNLWREVAERRVWDVFYLLSFFIFFVAWAGHHEVFSWFFSFFKIFWRVAAERGDLEVFLLLQILTLERDGLIFFLPQKFVEGSGWAQRQEVSSVLIQSVADPRFLSLILIPDLQHISCSWVEINYLGDNDSWTWASKLPGKMIIPMLMMIIVVTVMMMMMTICS